MNIEAFYKISYGLFAVCAEFGGKKNGYIANTAFQVTAEPARFAVACNKNNFTCDLIKKSGAFSFSILEENTKASIISTFGYSSGRDVEKFDGVEHKIGISGSPILLEDSAAYFDCKVVNTMDVGTHIIFIGELIDGDMIDETKTPMTYEYYRNIKKGKAPKNAPTYIAPERLNETKQEGVQGRYRCSICGYIYDEALGDPAHNIAPGTKFEDLPSDWECPICSADKDAFSVI